MKTNKIFTCVLYGAILVAGIFIGKLAFKDHSKQDYATEPVHPESEAQIWTCSMHPQIRQDRPGKCPICAMDLIPVVKATHTSPLQDPDAIQLSEEAAALANIQTMIVGHSHPVKEMRLYGVIKPNERLLRSQVSHVSGRIEKLVVNTVGETVRPGQVIATIYSPDWMNAQQELLEAQKLADTQPALLNAAREKLRLWKLTDKQIAEIEQTGAASSMLHVTANAGGIVTAKRVEQGDYVSQGGVLFDLADLSSVWAVFDAYESDLPYLKTGDKVEYTLQSLPGKTFSGKIAFIDPVLDKITRTAKIRVETPNPKLELKPEMYANAVIKTSVAQQGGNIVIPKTALLWTGKRSVVYIKQPGADIPTFKLREIELGASLGDEYVVLSGIDDGEEMVVNGVFTIDASAQLEGKPSMMNTGESHQASGQDNQATLNVQGLCGMCKDRIETTASGINSVSSAIWDGETKQLRLKFDPSKTSLDAIAKALAQAGHDNDKYRADDKVYNALPGCCQYRE
ncbi:MAG: efflux RND transporter periplasmic adaptor subunit [Dysgonamonadaceae bacterium]|jgi:Cu(I)/Ag(I) efflux system membrane fusion protein|nr:efflux RND transporter periplasmic adaptor subunit [Dysgonamonadaceae bacterium]